MIVGHQQAEFTGDTDGCCGEPLSDQFRLKLPTSVGAEYKCAFSSDFFDRTDVSQSDSDSVRLLIDEEPQCEHEPPPT